MPRSKPLLVAVSFVVGCLFATLDVRAGAISGVCPDGSIFIVQQAKAIPCRNAKRVDPADIPPLNPEFLPRPYGWEVFNRETDPNNPYNLVEIGRPAPLPQAHSADAPRIATPQPEMPTRAMAPATPVASSPPSPRRSTGLELGLSARELENLRAIIEISQDRAPATFVQRGDDGPRGITLRLAHSAAFASRVVSALSGEGAPEGRVIAFHAEAKQPDTFFGNLTFVQGHMAFHPDETDATQFGVMEGALGRLEPGQPVVGYLVLPTSLDLTSPIDVYWDDQLFTAQLRP